MARMGGDEFVLIIPTSDETGAAEVAAGIQAEIEQIGLRMFGEIKLSASWGISLYGTDGQRPEDLMAEADRRMYENKRSKNYRMVNSLTNMATRVVTREGDRNAEVLEPAKTRGS